MSNKSTDDYFGKETIEGLALTVGLVLIGASVMGVAMIPIAVADEAKKDKHLENSYVELVQVLSQKDIDEILEVNGVDNCIFNLKNNKLIVLADVDTKEKSEVTFAYEYKMSDSLYEVLRNSPTVFEQYSTNRASNGNFSNSMKLKEILDEIVEVSKGEVLLTYECSQNQLDQLNKVIYESENIKENTNTNTYSRR